MNTDQLTEDGKEVAELIVETLEKTFQTHNNSTKLTRDSVLKYQSSKELTTIKEITQHRHE